MVFIYLPPNKIQHLIDKSFAYKLYNIYVAIGSLIVGRIWELLHFVDFNPFYVLSE